MHYHLLAANVLAYGRKRWFLRHPAHAVFSATPAASWVHSDEFEPRAMLECVQEAGDVLIVPSMWAHATLNLEESVGIAYEFSGMSQLANPALVTVPDADVLSGMYNPAWPMDES